MSEKRTDNRQDREIALKELSKIMESELIIDDLFDNILPLYRQQVIMQLGDSIERENVDEMMAFMMSETKALSNRMVSEDIPSIYSRHLTDEEVFGLIEFYRSPVGQAYISKTPLIQKEILDSIMNKYMPEIRDEMMKRVMKQQKEAN
jgi:hypothetical protein